jgi:hypothetical protein
MQGGEQLDEIQPFDMVGRAPGAPRFLQRGSRGYMSAAGCHGRNQDAHGTALSLPERMGLEKQKGGLVVASLILNQNESQESCRQPTISG